MYGGLQHFFCPVAALEIHKDSEPHDRDEERALAAIEENKARVSRAEIALKAYDAATDKLGTLNNEHVIDLVTDIQHYLRFNSCSFIEPIQSARNHFHAEIAEEFFEQEQSHRDNCARYDKDEIIIVADQRRGSGLKDCKMTRIRNAKLQPFMPAHAD